MKPLSTGYSKRGRPPKKVNNLAPAKKAKAGRKQAPKHENEHEKIRAEARLVFRFAQAALAYCSATEQDELRAAYLVMEKRYKRVVRHGGVIAEALRVGR